MQISPRRHDEQMTVLKKKKKKGHGKREVGEESVCPGPSLAGPGTCRAEPGLDFTLHSPLPHQVLLYTTSDAETHAAAQSLP